MNIVVTGFGQHGKSTLAKIAREQFGLKTMGTSEFNAELMFSLMKDNQGYSTPEECHADRHQHRQYWYEEINRFCGDNPARVIEEIFSMHEICEGVRHKTEFDDAKRKGLVDFTIWVDASKRKPSEGQSSMSLTPADADIIIDNNDTEARFKARVEAVLGALIGRTVDEHREKSQFCL